LRLKCAKIKEPWVMETFPFERQPKLNKKKLMALYDSTNYLEQRQNLIFMGETGTGKTGLATAFLIHAINQGRTGRSIRFVDLVAELYTSLADHSQARVLKKYATVDVLLVDEVGTVEVEPVQAGLFFTLMQERHNKKSTFITSNLGFSEWRNFLKNDHLTAALINRLTENTHVFNLKGCVSIRPTLPQES
jgi:DNA replication protein DnaC